MSKRGKAKTGGSSKSRKGKAVVALADLPEGCLDPNDFRIIEEQCDSEKVCEMRKLFLGKFMQLIHYAK